MKRRSFIFKMAGVAAALPWLRMEVAMAHHGEIEKLKLDDAQWQEKLTAQQYEILRRHGTERAFTSPLNDEKRKGTFLCAGCDLELFTSDTKFDSCTGWPSFFNVVEGHVGTSTDYKLVVPRTEFHCARCGGHLGHVFKDGPKPTGLRYCSNGAVLKFVPAGAGEQD